MTTASPSERARFASDTIEGTFILMLEGKCPVQVYWFLFDEAKTSTPLTAMVLLWNLTKVV